MHNIQTKGWTFALKFCFHTTCFINMYNDIKHQTGYFCTRESFEHYSIIYKV